MPRFVRTLLLFGIFACAILATSLLSSCDALFGDDDDETEAAAYTDIVINEVQSSATSGYLSADFVELYNNSTAAYTFASGEWYISDSVVADRFYIPAGTTIAGNGYLVLLPDVTDLATVTSPSPPTGSIAFTAYDDTYKASFGLGKTDAVYLYYIGSDNSAPTTAVDSASWSGTHVMTRERYPDGDSWLLATDGSGDYDDVNTPTPGAANVE